MSAVRLALLPHQLEFVRAEETRVGLIAGRGSGKTYAGAARLIVSGMTQPGRYLALGPTYSDAIGTLQPAIRRLCDELQLPHDWLASRRELRIADRVTVDLASADAARRVRGREYHGAWVDEAAYVPDDTLADWLPAVRLGTPWVAVTTTPRGRRGWVYQWFGTPSRDVPTRLVRAGTADNPMLSAAAQATLRQQLAESPYWLAQELHGEFVDSAGVEWPDEFFGDWIYGRWDSLPNSQRVLAIDPSLGGDTGDYSAIVAAAWDRGLLWVEADISRRPPRKLVADALVLADAWRPHVIGVEAVAFQSLLLHEFQAQSRGKWALAGIKADGPKPLRIRRLGPLITRRLIRVADTPGGRLLVQQLRDFPAGQHDDGPDALEMACRLLTSG